MGTHRIAGALGIAVLLWPMLGIAADPAVDGQWVRGRNGNIPPSAIALGQEPDGRPQFLCRASFARGVLLGKIATGYGGCTIGHGGREVTLPSYEVLGARAAPPRVRLEGSIQSTTRGPEKAKGLAQGPALARPPLAGGDGGHVRRGFDDKGQPYVEEYKADGKIVRSMPNGVQITSPDGSRQFIPLQKTFANVQPPTPPELPPDPARGRNWIDLHNQALLSVISALVRGDDAELKKFSAAEVAQTGGDLFRQIIYRTQVVAFLAKDR